MSAPGPFQTSVRTYVPAQFRTVLQCVFFQMSPGLCRGPDVCGRWLGADAGCQRVEARGRWGQGPKSQGPPARATPTVMGKATGHGAMAFQPREHRGLFELRVPSWSPKVLDANGKIARCRLVLGLLWAASGAQPLPKFEIPPYAGFGIG